MYALKDCNNDITVPFIDDIHNFINYAYLTLSIFSWTQIVPFSARV
jgi:hypothetical protein